MSRDLEPPGALYENSNYEFSFNKVEKQYESYTGIGIKLRYFVQVTINRSYGKITKEEEFLVFNPTEEPDVNSTLKMEVRFVEPKHVGGYRRMSAYRI
jgi:vacuolar protein sorting-associated protein 26